ncbi:ABC transporter permease [Roseburia hominis]
MVTLWKKECRQILCSLIYWLYVIFLILFYTSQMGGMRGNMMTEPAPGQENYYRYGKKDQASEEEIMNYGLNCLVDGYMWGKFDTYPVGYIKEVTLSDEEQEEIGEILADMTGEQPEEFQKNMETYMQTPWEGGEDSWTPAIRDGYSYEAFLKHMERVCKIAGPGSEFEEDRLKSGARTSVDFEGAKKAYENLVEKDGYTGGYMRLFSDYMGIMLGILPVFLISSRILRDRRAEMQELIFTRKTSSAVIVTARYLAGVSMAMLPVIALSVMPMINCILFAGGTGMKLDYLAFLKYDLGWLLPSVLVVTALGFLITELTETPLAVLVQVIWWFVALQTGVNGMSGGEYGWTLIPRHNSVMNYGSFAEGFRQLVYNRLLYTILAVLLVAVTIGIYEAKRKGHLRRHGKILRNHKKSA